MKLTALTPALINQAIEIYLAHAYDDEGLREGHRIEIPPDTASEDVLALFEQEEAALRSYVLRLGCQHYPHMKLAIWEAYYEGEYVFAVDRHDGFDFDKTGPDYEAWMGIKSKNFAIKGCIEADWYAKGIPTIRGLKEDRLSRSDVMREFSGHEVLVVDNDVDAAAIIEMILSHAGYGCRCARSVEEVRDLLGDPVFPERCGLALVDLILTDGNGQEVIKLLRAKPETQEIPIVLTSAMRGEDADLGQAAGYLRKPYSAEDLQDMVAIALKRCYDGHDKLVDRLREAK